MDEATCRRLSALKAERARKYISGGGICREDSDDELGLEDYPWEWIYSYEICQTVDKATDSAVEMAQSTSKRSLFGTNNHRKAGNYDMPPGAIIGARMGNFECKVGDTVLLKADRANEAWVGLICEFVEDDDQGMSANFMWFSTEKEIRNKEKKRMDYMQVSCLI
jgi:origin recognition complex subunit 1